MLVQLPEHLNPNDSAQEQAAAFCDEIRMPHNIAEVTKERLRRAGNKIQRDSPMFAGDLGFRVFKLDSSNIRAWEPDPDDLEQSLLDNVEHIKEGRSEQDILYELLLKLGLDLCAPIEMRDIAGRQVNVVDGGALIVCLAEKIGQAEVEQLALGITKWRQQLENTDDMTVVFRDSAFADDIAKTNLTEILRQHGVKNVRSL